VALVSSRRHRDPPEACGDGAGLLARIAVVLSAIMSFALGAGGAYATNRPLPLVAETATAHFAEPLVRTGPTTAAEDAALSQTVAAYERRTQPGDISSLNAYLAEHPHSGWDAAILTNLGLSYIHDGYFSRAISAWRLAWADGKDATDPKPRALIDRAIGELARLYASLASSTNSKPSSTRLGHDRSQARRRRLSNRPANSSPWSPRTRGISSIADRSRSSC
jgi:hypothetical protein